MSDKPGAPFPSRLTDAHIVKAGEVALGLSQEGDLKASLRKDPDFISELDRWHRHFGRLVEELEPMQPSPRVWVGLQEQLRSREARDPHWGRRLKVWRWTSGVGLAAAFIMAAWIVSTPRRITATVPNPGVLVASILPKDGNPLFTATFDRGRRLLIVIPAAVSENKDRPRRLLLWLSHADEDPMKLAALDEARETIIPVAANVAELLGNDTSLVVTSEPTSGSPSPVAPGPVIAHGRLRSF